MVKRSNHPSIGFWATPGGFVELKEDISEGAARELEEETCVKGTATAPDAYLGRMAA